MAIRVNVTCLDKFLAIQFVAIVVKRIAPIRSTSHIQCWSIYKCNQQQLHLLVKIYHQTKVQKCAKQFTLQMENHICMVKYGELVSAQAGDRIQVDPCTNGGATTDRSRLLSPVLLSILKDRP